MAFLKVFKKGKHHKQEDDSKNHTPLHLMKITSGSGSCDPPTPEPLSPSFDQGMELNGGGSQSQQTYKVIYATGKF